MYFPEFKEEEGKLVRNPLSGILDITTTPSEVQDEFLDLKHDSAAKDLYEEKSLNVFWCSMHHSYPKVSEIALRLLLPFSTTYLCESGFSPHSTNQEYEPEPIGCGPRHEMCIVSDTTSDSSTD